MGLRQPKPNRLPRALLAADHALLLGAFGKLLSPDCDIVGQVSVTIKSTAELVQYAVKNHIV